MDMTNTVSSTKKNSRGADAANFAQIAKDAFDRAHERLCATLSTFTYVQGVSGRTPNGNVAIVVHGRFDTDGGLEFARALKQLAKAVRDQLRDADYLHVEQPYSWRFSTGRVGWIEIAPHPFARNRGPKPAIAFLNRIGVPRE